MNSLTIENEKCPPLTIKETDILKALKTAGKEIIGIDGKLTLRQVIAVVRAAENAGLNELALCFQLMGGPVEIKTDTGKAWTWGEQSKSIAQVIDKEEKLRNDISDFLRKRL